MRAVFFFCLCLFLSSCSCSSSSPKNTVRIGVDPGWYPIDFGPQEPFVNGFAEDLLLEIAHLTGVNLERISANWDNLFEGLQQKKYDAVLSSLPPYQFHMAKYDFSENFLELGPVLILPMQAPDRELKEMQGEIVGILEGDPAGLLVEPYSGLLLRNYSSIPELLTTTAQGTIQGALLDRLPAAHYVADLYAGQLKIASPPLTKAGLHLVALKGNRFVNVFDEALGRLKKKKKLEALWEKWDLD